MFTLTLLRGDSQAYVVYVRQHPSIQSAYDQIESLNGFLRRGDVALITSNTSNPRTKITIVKR